MRLIDADALSKKIQRKKSEILQEPLISSKECGAVDAFCDVLEYINDSLTISEMSLNDFLDVLETVTYMSGDDIYNYFELECPTYADRLSMIISTHTANEIIEIVKRYDKDKEKSVKAKQVDKFKELVAEIGTARLEEIEIELGMRKGEMTKRKLSATDIDGLFCDDITFCLENCDRIDCPRNQSNIRDKSIPHSFSLEIASDCPKLAEEENKIEARSKAKKCKENR